MISTQKISLNSKVVQTEGNIVSDMDGEKVMLSIESG
ncbi:PqqD family protein, partial [Neobacillus drentensis]